MTRRRPIKGFVPPHSRSQDQTSSLITGSDRPIFPLDVPSPRLTDGGQVVPYACVPKVCQSRVGPSACSSSLVYLPFRQRGLTFIGLVDTGAQLNLVSRQVADRWLYKVIQCPIKSFASVNNSQSTIDEWIKCDLLLLGGVRLPTSFAVTSLSPSYPVILGLPFLLSCRAVLDLSLLEFQTKDCSVPLLMNPTIRRSLARPHRPASKNVVNVAVTDRAAYEGGGWEALDESDEKELEDAFVDVPSDLVPAFRHLLMKHSVLWRHRKRGTVRGVAHEITLTHHRPIVSRPRPRTVEQTKCINTEIDIMLQDGVIRPSASPYVSEIVLVAKKTGGWRMCLDYRPLNIATILDQYPLPRLAELIRAVGLSKYFVALDLRSGYWQILMEPSSIPYTAFRTPTGLYEFLVMPFGLTNAPATFQRAMNFLFEDLCFQGVLVYLDDVLIHASTVEELLRLLDVVLSRLAAAGYTLNLQKSQFMPVQLLYLGHVLENGQIRPNPQKVDAIRLLKPPTTVAAVKSLLGVLGYTQHFIRDYSGMVAPITNLLRGQAQKKKNMTSVVWTPECQTSLEQAQGALADAVLAQPLDADEYKLETDASSWALGGALYAKRDGEWLPVHFVSKKFNTTECNWPIREKEAYAIIYSLQQLSYYCLGRRIAVYTDHQNLQWLMTAKTGKLARWACLLAEYDLEIHYLKGRDNQVADYLSRFVHDPDPVEDYMVYAVHRSADSPSPGMLREVLAAQNLETTHLTKGYHVVDGVIYYRGKIFVPLELRDQVITDAHLAPPHLHPGTKKTKSTILRMFNWPNLHEHVTGYVSSCLTCQRLRNLPSTHSLSRHNPLSGTMSVLHIDFWSCTIRGESFTCLTMIDAFTKWVEAKVVHTKTAVEAANTILCEWICRFGCPARLVSDNEKSFTSAVMSELCAELGIEKVETIPYRPQGNAFVEAVHKSLNKYFKLHDLHHRDIEFPVALQLALFAYRSQVHTATGYSPAFLLFGYDPTISASDWRAERLHPSEKYFVLTKLRVDLLDQLVSQYAASKAARTEVTIAENDLVLAPYNVREMHVNAVDNELSNKLGPKWTLPYRVIRVEGGRATLRSPLDGTIKTMSIDNLRPIQVPPSPALQQEWIHHIVSCLIPLDYTRSQIKRVLSEVGLQGSKRVKIMTALEGELM